MGGIRIVGDIQRVGVLSAGVGAGEGGIVVRVGKVRVVAGDRDRRRGTILLRWNKINKQTV